jgi:hypothetical protein
LPAVKGINFLGIKKNSRVDVYVDYRTRNIVVSGFSSAGIKSALGLIKTRMYLADLASHTNLIF